MHGPEDFEEIVSGQLPPDKWYIYGLDADFPHLEPASQVGEIALAFGGARSALISKWEDIFEENDNGIEIDKARFEAQDKAWHKVELHRKIFSGFYDSLVGHLKLRQESGSLPSLSDGIITATYHRQLEAIHGNPNYPEKLAKDLHRLVHGLSMAYDFETGQHFRELQGLPMDRCPELDRD